MIYFTYNDLPSGIYNSQVIDVCRFIKTDLKHNIRLVALISIRGFSGNRKIIKEHLPDAIVFPMLPKHKNWKWNSIILNFILLFTGKQAVICRGVFAANIALKLKSRNRITKIIFDGRGAYKAEFQEYLNRIVDISDNIAILEENAVLNSDFRMAVSEKLIDYWKKEYRYIGSPHVVIPCTLSSQIASVPSEESIKKLRSKLNYNDKDVLLIYSGSTADWQSIDDVDAFLIQQLTVNENLKVILLSRFKIEKLESFKRFPDRMIQKWVNVDEVKDYLSISDYGILIREHSITSKVASPTKFAEYLHAGLKVVISPEIGDFTDLVRENDLGYVYKDNNVPDLKKVEHSEKRRMCMFANTNFTKENYVNEYTQIIGFDKVK